MERGSGTYDRMPCVLEGSVVVQYTERPPEGAGSVHGDGCTTLAIDDFFLSAFAFRCRFGLCRPGAQKHWTACVRPDSAALRRAHPFRVTRMSATVDARLPLSLLEAVRFVDTPEGNVEAEYIEELRTKRLGLSDTVYAQIKRYSNAVRRNERTVRDEAAALARLIGRRTDAHRVFDSAGSLLAREAIETVSVLRRNAIRRLPGMVARPMALTALSRLAKRYLDARVDRVGGSVILAVRDPVTIEGSAIAGFAFYASAFSTLMEELTGYPAVVTRIDGTACGQSWKATWGRS